MLLKIGPTLNKICWANIKIICLALQKSDLLARFLLIEICSQFTFASLTCSHIRKLTSKWSKTKESYIYYKFNFQRHIKRYIGDSSGKKKGLQFLADLYLYGSPGRARTADLVINSHPLYQLSYRGIISYTFNMARPERFELPTARFVAEYSIQLSYGRFVDQYIIYFLAFFVN